MAACGSTWGCQCSSPHVCPGIGCRRDLLRALVPEFAEFWRLGLSTRPRVGLLLLPGHFMRALALCAAVAAGGRRLLLRRRRRFHELSLDHRGTCRA